MTHCHLCDDASISGSECADCERYTCDDCLNYRETEPASAHCPADGVMVCDRCLLEAEDSATDAAIQRHEDRNGWWQ